MSGVVGSLRRGQRLCRYGSFVSLLCGERSRLEFFSKIARGLAGLNSGVEEITGPLSYSGDLQMLF